MIVKKSYSFMSSDVFPAAFYITNPNNHLINNRAHGSERYGFQYDLGDSVKEVNRDSTICPSGIPLGTFYGNKATSNQFYGLKIPENYHPRTKPCEDTRFDYSDAAEPAPYGSNKPICAVFEELSCIRNSRSCVVSDAKGCV